MCHVLYLQLKQAAIVFSYQLLPSSCKLITSAIPATTMLSMLTTTTTMILLVLSTLITTTV